MMASALPPNADPLDEAATEDDLSETILETHYGVVRYLYQEIFLKRRSQINDLQNQTMFLSCINKYLLCETSQFGHLRKMYSNLEAKKIEEYYELNRRKINRSETQWLSFCCIYNAPRILPLSIDGPYTVDSLSLRRYTYFWGRKFQMKSNILATPYYCLDGIDHLYSEMTQWQNNSLTMTKTSGVKLKIKSKHIFHEMFYLADITSEDDNDPSVTNVKFLMWLDDVDIQTELYTIQNGDMPCENDDGVAGRGTRGGRDFCLLKRLYIACDNVLVFNEILNGISEDKVLGRIEKLLNIFVNNLSRHFVVTFNGRPPINPRVCVLDVTNRVPDGSVCASNEITFENISRTGFNVNKNNQIYELESMAALNISQIGTPYFLVLQDLQYISVPPTVSEMTRRFRQFLQLLSYGMIDRSIFMRLFIMPQTNNYNFPISMTKQLAVVYMQRYNRFAVGDNSREIDYNPTFLNRTYVFSCKHLTSNVKSLRYVIRDCINLQPLIPPVVMLLPHLVESQKDEIAWVRITQNIIYLKRLRTVCFLRNFTPQELNIGTGSSNMRFTRLPDEIKKLTIVSETKIRQELNEIFKYSSLGRFDVRSVAGLDDVDLKCINLDRHLHLDIYYFAHNGRISTMPDEEEKKPCQDNVADEEREFRRFFTRFMTSLGTLQSITDTKLYNILVQMYNLQAQNILL